MDGYAFTKAFTNTRPSTCLARMLFMKRAVPSDFS
jgi:hypothetical protein